MSTALSFSVNGAPHDVETDPDRPLLEVLREDLGLTGTKYGCGEGRCRACTVLVAGKPLLSCVTPVSKVAGQALITIEGLAEGKTLHAVQEAFLAEEAFQCGFCTPGLILQTVALLERTPSPSDEEILEGLNPSLCRCCGYPNILNAARRAAGRAQA